MSFGGWRLRSQIALLVLGVLFLAQGVSLWLFVDERSLAVRAAIGAEAAGRAANVARLIEGTPSDLHDQIVRAASSPLVSFDLTDTPRVTYDHEAADGATEQRVRALLGDSFSRDIRIEVHPLDDDSVSLPNLPPEAEQLYTELMQGTLAPVEMDISIALAGGRWLNVGTRFERPPIQWSMASTLSFGLTAALLLITSFWFLLARLTGPLNTLATATDALGRGAAEGALPVVGPREVRDLTTTFNTMQERLTRYVSDRTLMLAALAHDLRSPLTAMRVRAEMVDDPEARRGLVVNMDEMQAMVEATLDFAKGVGSNEPTVPTDLTKLIGTLEMTGLHVNTVQSRVVPVRPAAMRRALRNLIDNAVRYGGRAHVTWSADADIVEIRIEDFGPGLPEDALERVFTPYLRLETSRSRETGGHGLGLSIARSVVLAHGGTLTLHNKPEGGLVATVRLPIQPPGTVRPADVPSETVDIGARGHARSGPVQTALRPGDT